VRNQRTHFEGFQRPLNRRNLVHYLEARWTTIEREIGVLPQPRILDVGCGDGELAQHLVRRGGCCTRVFGVDLAHTRARNAAEQVGAVRFMQADAGALPFSSGSFGLVICNALLHHVRDPIQVADEMLRVCAPCGYVAMVEPNRANPLILAQALLKSHERGTLVLNMGRVKRHLSAHPSVLKVVARPLTTLHYPFQSLPPPWLSDAATFVERVLNIPHVSTHTVLVVRMSE
jgi:2-polyprenyl-3-methyl-5-hydroxy-6-metoxy-1,4-benzoquinol methylase